MAKVIDVAYAIIDHSVEIAQEKRDNKYFVDFFKLHKLLYYAQMYMLVVHGERLFEEEIEAHSCGPYIPQLLRLPMGGFGPITEKCNQGLPLTTDRMEAIDYVVRTYGQYSANELVANSRQSEPYIKAYETGKHNTITQELMEQCGDRVLSGLIYA